MVSTIFPKGNKIKVTSNIDTSFPENKRKLEVNSETMRNNYLAEVELPDVSDENFFKTDKYYNNDDPEYVKLYTYINNLSIKPLNEVGLYQIIDLTNDIVLEDFINDRDFNNLIKCLDLSKYSEYRDYTS